MIKPDDAAEPLPPAGPGAAVACALMGAALTFGPGLGLADDIALARRKVLDRTEPFRRRQQYYSGLVHDIAARLEDEHAAQFAASPEWDRLVAANPALHVKIVRDFRAAAARRAQEPPAPKPRAPEPPVQPGGFAL